MEVGKSLELSSQFLAWSHGRYLRQQNWSATGVDEGLIQREVANQRVQVKHARNGVAEPSFGSGAQGSDEAGSSPNDRVIMEHQKILQQLT